MTRRMRSTSLPVAALLAICALSLGARAAWLGAPCHARCIRPADHLLIFDEAYYVNAARVIAGLRPPAGANYWRAPLGVDPNAEHPQLVKLLIAGAIELLGDGPPAWRLGSLLAGTLALLGMFALARAAGASAWVAVAAAGLMAADNLLLVFGRIGTLDIFAVAAMVGAVALYLRGRWLLGGVVLGVGIACKEVAVDAVLVVALFELLRVSRGRLRGAAGAVAGFAAAAAGAFAALLAAMDRIAPPYDPIAGRLVTGGVLGHLGHIVSYGAHQISPHGPRGIASYPWEWLADVKPIVYLSIDPSQPAPGLTHDHPAMVFLGLISPPVLLLGLAGLALVLRRGVRTWDGGPGTLGVAWFLGTWAPFELLSLIGQRTSYLYYMAIVMPGLYLAGAALLGRGRSHPRLAAAGVGLVVLAALVLYPLDPLL